MRMHAGEAGLIQRGQDHKRRNVVDHLPDEHKADVRRKMQNAFAMTDYADAKRDQDRLVKLLRLAKISTREAANAFLETEYWPEWNARFARPVQDFPNQHRPLAPDQDLAAILCHVEPRVMSNDYTFSFAGQRYQIAREDVQAGMRHQRLRVELWLKGDLQARYQGRYLKIAECVAQAVVAGRILHHARRALCRIAGVGWQDWLRLMPLPSG